MAMLAMNSIANPKLPFLVHALGILAMVAAPQTLGAAPAALQFLAQPQGRDIGSPGMPGSSAVSPGDRPVLSLTGAGADIWGAADSCHYVFQEFEGDFQLVLRVVTMESTHPWAKAGIMIRQDLEAVSPQVMLAITPENGVALIRREQRGRASEDDAHQAMRMVGLGAKRTFQQRGSAGVEAASDSIAAARLPRWLKLVKKGSLLSAYDSADATEWAWVGSIRQEFPTRYLLGLAVSSHDHARMCRAEFSGLQLQQISAEPIQAPVTGAGQGLRGRYFASYTQTGPETSRIDPVIDFDWGRNPPAPGMPGREFTVRWDGELQAQYTEPYALHIVSDDRARVWLDGNLIIDEWYEHGESISSAIVNLEQGKRYPLRVDFYQNRGRAMVKLLWSSPSTPRQVVPQRQLFPELSSVSPEALEKNYQFQLAPAPREVSVTGPGAAPGWLAADVGQIGVEGHAEFTGSQWKLSGSGADIWANADAFHFLYQAVRGDFEIVARLASQTATDPWAKAGIMVRQNLLADSRQFMLAATPGSGLALLEREFTGRSTSVHLIQEASPVRWLKVQRKGPVVTAFTSAEGQQWNWRGSACPGFDETVYIGLAVNSHDNSRLGEAVFEEVSLRERAAEPPPEGVKGQGSGLLATYFDAQSGKTVSRIDPTVDFNWDIDAPCDGIGPDMFTARWEGTVQAQFNEPYAFHVVTDDGGRLWLDGELVIDAWSDRAMSQVSAVRQLAAGRHYAVRLEYYDRSGEAVARLLWSSPSTPKQPIPSGQLYPAAPPVREPASVADGPANLRGRELPLSAALELLGSVREPPATSKITGATIVSKILGVGTSSQLGSWGINGGATYAISRRGWVEYELNITAADIYLVDIEGASHNPHDLDPVFYIIVSIDGQHLGRMPLDAPPGHSGSVRALLPYLQPGTHRLRVYWDNARLGRSLALNALRLVSLEGPDSNSDGLKDWAEDYLRAQCSLDRPTFASSDPIVLRSATSPVCLEGRGRFLGMMRVEIDGRQITPRAAPANRWFVDAELVAGTPSTLKISYQNGGRTESARITWEPTDLIGAQDMDLRAGDALLLRCAPKPTNDAQGSSRPATIAVNGAIIHQGDPAGWTR